jgi:hypothetical protein
LLPVTSSTGSHIGGFSDIFIHGDFRKRFTQNIIMQCPGSETYTAGGMRWAKKVGRVKLLEKISTL